MTSLYFQQDRAHLPIVHVTQYWTAMTHHCRFFHSDMWPPNSPDLNLVDYAIWSVIQQRVSETRVHMTSMSCDGVYCMCGAAWSCSSRWLVMQLTNTQHPCVLVFVPETDILNIHCGYQFVFPVLDELCASHHAWCSRRCSKSAL